MGYIFRGTSYEAVIFDCDGVLADSEPYWHKAELQLCANHGVAYPSGISTKGETMVGTIRKLLPGLKSSQAIQSAIDEYVGYARDLLQMRVLPLPGVPGFVRQVSKIAKVGVASNSPRLVLDVVLREIGIHGLVQASTSGDEVALGKPDPDIYLKTARKLRAEGLKTLVFEDSVIGASAASAAGFDVVQIIGASGTPFSTPIALAHFQSFEDISEVVF